MQVSRRVLLALLISLVVVAGTATGAEKGKKEHSTKHVGDVPDEKDILKDLEALNADIKQERSRQKKEHAEIKKMLRGMSKKGLKESEEEENKPRHHKEEHHKEHNNAHTTHHKHRNHELSHSKKHHGHKEKTVKAAEETLLSEDEEDTSSSEAMARSKLLSAFIKVDKLPVSIASELSKNHEILSLGKQLEILGSKRERLVKQQKETSHIDKMGRHVSDKLKAAVEKGVQEIYSRQIADVRNGDDDDNDDSDGDGGDDFDDVRSEAVGSDATEMDEEEGSDDSEDNDDDGDTDGGHHLLSRQELSSVGDPESDGNMDEPPMEDLAETPAMSKPVHVTQMLKRPLLPNQKPPTPTNGGDGSDGSDDEDDEDGSDDADESDGSGTGKELSEVGHSSKQAEKAKKAVKSVAKAQSASKASSRGTDAELMEAAAGSDGSTNLRRDVVTEVQVNKGKKKSPKSVKALKKVPSNGDDSDDDHPSNNMDDGVIGTTPDATNGDDELSSFEEGLKKAFAGLTKGVKGVHVPVDEDSKKKSMAEMVEDSLHGKLDVDDKHTAQAESSEELNKTIEKSVDEQMAKLGLATVGM